MDKNPSAPPLGHAGGMQTSLGNAECAALTEAQTAGCPSPPQLHSAQQLVKLDRAPSSPVLWLEETEQLGAPLQVSMLN